MIKMPTVDSYRVDLFDMTRTMRSWLAGFPARLAQASLELGPDHKGMLAAKQQMSVVQRAQANCEANNGKTIKNVIFAASKLNDMLIKLEHEMIDRRERETVIKWHEPNCPAVNFMGVCECRD